MKKLQNNAPKSNIFIRIAAILLCLTLVSTYLSTRLFARYTSGTAHNDAARVAKFSIKGSGQLSQSIVAEVIPGKATTQNLIIENNSEVAVEYTVTVTNKTNNLPLTFSMKNIDNTLLNAATNDNTYTFTASQLPGNHIDKYNLSIEWPVDQNGIGYMGMVDYITVTVTAAQID